MTSPVVQWLRKHASTAGGLGLIPGQETKISHPTSQDPKNRETKTKHRKETGQEEVKAHYVLYVVKFRSINWVEGRQNVCGNHLKLRTLSI